MLDGADTSNPISCNDSAAALAALMNVAIPSKQWDAIEAEYTECRDNLSVG